MQRHLLALLIATAVLFISGFAHPGSVAWGQGRRPPSRKHTANQKKDIELVKADQTLDAQNVVAVKLVASVRVLEVNGIPEHNVGRFPNRGNPHKISKKKSVYKVARTPKTNGKPKPVGMNNFGIAVNGILFDPGAAEFWLGNVSSKWRYEALSGAIPLGLDENFGHVQPDGKYHYHGIPSGLLETLKAKKDKHSPLVGWAADGFPIYARLGYEDPKDPNSKIANIRSSYQIKKGERPGGGRGDPLRPGGTYDGTFVLDYEFVQDSGDLDECNGRFSVTPEFPEGTYAYFLTEDWPVVPRFFRGTPNSSFAKQGGGGRRGQGGQVPGSGRRGRGQRRGGGYDYPTIPGNSATEWFYREWPPNESGAGT